MCPCMAQVPGGRFYSSSPRNASVSGHKGHLAHASVCQVDQSPVLFPFISDVHSFLGLQTGTAFSAAATPVQAPSASAAHAMSIHIPSCPVIDHISLPIRVLPPRFSVTCPLDSTLTSSDLGLQITSSQTKTDFILNLQPNSPPNSITHDYTSRSDNVRTALPIPDFQVRSPRLLISPPPSPRYILVQPSFPSRKHLCPPS